MRNIIGNPAEGDDFFDRPKILAKLRRQLENSANILLVAPRRVGKTSVVIRLCEEWRAEPHRKAVYLNVEGRGEELAFAEKLIDELAKAGLHPELMTRAMGFFSKLRQKLAGGIQVPGLEISLGDATDVDHSTLGKLLESIFRNIEESDTTVLIAIDELPEFLLTLQKSQEGPRRVAAFLHWLRELRQTYRKQIRWLFLGSIGLDNFVEDQKLQKAINDLQIVALDAFTPEEADNFLQQLGDSNKLPLEQAERRDIIKYVGWPLAFHLQLVFHQLVELESRSIDLAVDALLRPENFGYYDTWRQRIDDQFSVVDAAACKEILSHLCRNPGGRERGQILDVLMAKNTANQVQVDEQLTRLLIVLQRDGYLLQSDRQYAFRSFLLREYWFRRHVA